MVFKTTKITTYINPEELKNINSIRSSIVPYTIIRNSVWFLMGIDKESGDITDFGGGVKKDENNLDAAYREFEEETKGIFTDKIIDDSNLDKTSALISYKLEDKEYQMSTLFIPLKSSYSFTTRNFLQVNKEEKDKNEIKDLLWITSNEFMLLLQGRHDKYILWNRIRHFYRSVNFFQLIKKLRYKTV